MASVTILAPDKRGHVRARIRVHVGQSPTTGKPVYITRVIHAPGERSARKRAAPVIAELEAEAEAMRGTFQRQRDGRATVGEVLDLWLAAKEREASQLTMRVYRRHAGMIAKRFGPMEAAKLKRADVLRWWDELLAKTPDTRQLPNIYRSFSAAMNWALERDLIDRLPTSKASPPKVARFESRALTPAAAAHVIDALPDADWARAVHLAVLTGMRRAEIVALGWDAIAQIDDGDQLRGVIRVQRSAIEDAGKTTIKPPKSGKARNVGFGAQVEAILAAQLAATSMLGSPWVFPRDDDPSRCRCPSWLSHAWMRYRHLVGASATRLHDLRHTAGSIGATTGESVTALRSFLGHAAIDTTMIYVHDLEVSAVGPGIERAIEAAR